MINRLINELATEMICGVLTTDDLVLLKTKMKQISDYVEKDRIENNRELSILKNVKDSTKAGIVFSAIATNKLYFLAPQIAYYFLSDSYIKTQNKSILYERLKIIIRNLDDYDNTIAFVSQNDDCAFNYNDLFNLPIMADVYSLGLDYQSQEKWWKDTITNCNNHKNNYSHLSCQDIIKKGNLGHIILMRNFSKSMP